MKLTIEQEIQTNINKVLYGQLTLELGVDVLFSPEGNPSDYFWEGTVIIESGGGQIADTGDYNDWYCIVNNGLNGQTDISDYDEEDLIILGKPIVLDSLLLYLGKHDNQVKLTCLDNMVEIIYDDFDEAMYWKLNLPLIKQDKEFKHNIKKIIDNYGTLQQNRS